MSYIGTEPKDIRSFGRTKFDYTATQGQTAFTGADDDGKVLAFTVGQIEVYVNGILMDDSDFTTTGTGTVTLASAANLNDVINIVSFETNIPDSNYVPATGGTFTGDVTHTGAFTSQGIDDNANATAITIDSSENVLVGKTAIGLSTTGIDLRSNGLIQAIRDGGTTIELNRLTSDGTIADFRRDGTSVGTIGYGSGVLGFGQGTGNLGLFNATVIPMGSSTGAASDGVISLGGSNSRRFKDLYLSGGVYLGGTAAVNHLDDYEEGTWTPTLTTDGGGSATYANQIGWYRKVGNVVTVGLQIYNTAHSGSGLCYITGLPFAHATGYESVGIAQMNAHSDSFSSVLCSLASIVQSGQTKIHMRGTYYDTTSGPYYVQLQNFTYLRITITYPTG